MVSVKYRLLQLFIGIFIGMFIVSLLTQPVKGTETITGVTIDCSVRECNFVIDNNNYLVLTPNSTYNTNLVLYLPFSFNQPSSTEDISGEENDGTCTNCPSSVANGKYGRAYNYTSGGADDYFTITDSDNFSLGQYTLGAWIKPEGTSGTIADDMYIYAHADSDYTDQITIKITDDNGEKGRLEVINKYSSTETQINYNQDLMDSAWHHVVVVRNATHYSFYIDGEFKQSYTDNSAGIVINPNNPVGIGDLHVASTEGFNGLIDELFLIKAALSHDAIISSYKGMRSTQGNVTQNYSFSEEGDLINITFVNEGEGSVCFILEQEDTPVSRCTSTSIALSSNVTEVNVTWILNTTMANQTPFFNSSKAEVILSHVTESAGCCSTNTWDCTTGGTVNGFDMGGNPLIIDASLGAGSITITGDITNCPTSGLRKIVIGQCAITYQGTVNFCG
jgi:hypothetical protein